MKSDIIKILAIIRKASDSENKDSENEDSEKEDSEYNQVLLDKDFLQKCNESCPKQTCFQDFQPGPRVIKLFSCSTQLSMKFKMLINIKIAKNNGNFRFRSQKPAIYPANKC